MTTPRGDDADEREPTTQPEVAADDAPAAPRGGSIAGVDLQQALGGRRGVVDSGVPGAVFITVFTISGQQLGPALWAALGVAGALAVLRVVRREPLQQALTGVIGVAIAAAIAARTGRAADFYLPGLFIQGGYAAAYFVSVAAGWPLIGVIVGPLLGEGLGWRKDPPRRRAYTVVTLLWGAMFLLRLAVQLPLYLTDQVVALGVVRLVMGWPIFLVVAWISYVIIRSAPPPQQHLADVEPDGPAPAGHGPAG